MSQSAARLRLSSPGDLVEAVPYLLGFHPRQSVVVLALRGPRRRLVLTMRLDLPMAGESPGALADGIAARVAHAGGEVVVLVVFAEFAPSSGARPAGGASPTGVARTPDRAAVPVGRDPDLPHDGLVTATTAALRGCGIQTSEAVYASVGRWWSYTCVNPACCPPEGTPVDVCSPVAAAATYAGLVALPSREALADSLQPVSGDRSGMLAELRAAARDLAGGSAAVRPESLRLLTDAVGTECELSDRAASRLVVGLADVGIRDACCEWALTSRREAARRLWTGLARLAPPPYDAAPLCLVGWFAYLDGDATLAGMAVERCLRSDPAYSLALLLQKALDGAMDPAVLRRCLGAPAGSR